MESLVQFANEKENNRALKCYLVFYIVIIGCIYFWLVVHCTVKSIKNISNIILNGFLLAYIFDRISDFEINLTSL